MNKSDTAQPARECSLCCKREVSSDGRPGTQELPRGVQVSLVIQRAMHSEGRTEHPAQHSGRGLVRSKDGADQPSIAAAVEQGRPAGAAVQPAVHAVLALPGSPRCGPAALL